MHLTMGPEVVPQYETLLFNIACRFLLLLLLLLRDLLRDPKEVASHINL